MEIIQNLAALGVEAYGVGMAVIGVISFSEGKSQHNAGAQSEGMSKIIGGAVIFLVGMMGIPAIFGMLSI